MKFSFCIRLRDHFEVLLSRLVSRNQLIVLNRCHLVNWPADWLIELVIEKETELLLGPFFRYNSGNFIKSSVDIVTNVKLEVISNRSIIKCGIHLIGVITSVSFLLVPAEYCHALIWGAGHCWIALRQNVADFTDPALNRIFDAVYFLGFETYIVERVCLISAFVVDVVWSPDFRVVLILIWLRQPL